MNSIQVISNILKNNIGTSIFICWFLFFLIPKALFDQAISPVLLDKDHELLGAKIADEGGEV